jgi:hypothetical protein
MLRLRLIAIVSCLYLSSVAWAEVPVVDDWKFVLRRPAQGWQQPGFDDSEWRDGTGGFGKRGTPGARIGTQWSRPNIWLRKHIDLDSVPSKPALLVHHDEDAEVFLNGKLIATLPGYTQNYEVVPIAEEHHEAIKSGENVLAVRCLQKTGGQFIDVHLVSADNVPELPPVQASTEPFKTELVTKWGEQVTAENAWTEYPRPQMARDEWQNLNGTWKYTITSDKEKSTPSEWQGDILVPFALESKLSGVQRLLAPNEALWYKRTFEVKKSSQPRTILHFEAVDYASEVRVNGKVVGTHQGGNVPFSFDVTEFVKDGENELVVRVEDDTEAFQLRGKQVLDPNGIWYTQVSGIWQTVWLETVSDTYVDDLVIATSAKDGTINVDIAAAGAGKATAAQLIVKDGDAKVAEAKGKLEGLSVTVPDAKLWSPDSPHLYDLEIVLLDDAGKELDRVKSYAGIRDIGKMKDSDGHWRFTLNGKEVFHWGPLDQGWWPDGLLTPPSDEAMLYDIEYLKQAGFNMIRKHIKVEPRRYYYHCDRIGMMVWQDQVSGGASPPWTRMAPNPTDANWPDKHHEQYMAELEEMIDHLENHPSIVVWVPFNEAWGQHRTMEVGEWTAKRDPSRLVNVASGGNFWPVGDVADEHSYPDPGFPLRQQRFGDYVKVVGEFGGHGLPVEGHLWDADRDNWGYGGLPKNEAEYKQRYVRSLDKLKSLRDQGIAAGVYTQTTDVEGEINGLLTYDRKVIKFPAEELAELHKPLLEEKK